MEGEDPRDPPFLIGGPHGKAEVRIELNAYGVNHVEVQAHRIEPLRKYETGKETLPVSLEC